MDLFEKLIQNYGPLGQYHKQGEGYFFFPKLEGEIGPRMKYRGKERLVWSLNDYLGLANHPEVRKADAEGAAKWGLAYPMGARMMSGQTVQHEEVEKQLAAFVNKEAAYLLNFGYQGMVSILDALVDRKDVIVYDSEAHACILDGVRLHIGKRFVYPHNNMEMLRKNLERATKMVEETGGSILVITEGVYSMVGDLGKLKDIVDMKKDFQFRLIVDDAHGFGTMGPTGAGTPEHFGVQDEVDMYFATFAKSMASIGGFIASRADVINYLRYNMRSQIFAKSLPMPLVLGAKKRLELLKSEKHLHQKLWENIGLLQKGLKEKGLNLGMTESPVTPVFLSGNLAEATNLTYDLRENYNIFCTIIIYPVVPKDVILIRLVPTALHTKEDIEYTVNAFYDINEKLKKGMYSKTEMANISE